MKFLLAALLGATAYCQAAADLVADNQAAADDAQAVQDAADQAAADLVAADEQAWYDSFSGDVAEDLVTVACLCYDDLSTWDLRPMSFPADSGYYYAWSGNQELVFNPCAFLNFAADYTTFDESDPSGYTLPDLSEAIGEITHATFTAYRDDASSPWVALTAAGDWKATSTTALYELDEEGNTVSKDDTLGLRVSYTSEEVCGEGFYTFTYDVMCDETIVNADDPMAFAAANYASSNLDGCDKMVTFDHNAGCSVYSALGFVNFLNENVWLSGTLLLIFGLGIGLFGQKWFLPITGGFGALCAFVAFMIMASIFQWLNTTVGLIICGIFAIASGVLAYWVLSTEQIATMFLCIGGGFMLGSVIEGLIIAISSWESMVFYLIITISCMVIGGLIGCKKPLLVQKYLTAIVGSYIFMRGWTYFLGGFPSEMEMYNMMAHPTSEELDFTGLFWFYVALWAAGVFFFIYVQSTWEYAKSSEDKKTTEANSGHYTH